MAVRLEGPIRRYIGLSTDDKPVLGLQFDGSTIAASDLPSASSFLETDTGLIYRWNGADTWTLAAAGTDEQLSVLQAILIEITQLRELTELRLAVGA